MLDYFFVVMLFSGFEIINMGMIIGDILNMWYCVLHPKKALKQFIIDIINTELNYRDELLKKHLKENYDMFFDLLNSIK